MTEPALILLLAVAFDLALGEPPNSLHPVAWMGHCLAAVRRGGAGRRPAAALAVGTAGLAIGLAGWGGAAWGLVALLREAPPALRIALEAAALKTTFSLRRLLTAAGEVRAALAARDLAEARQGLGAHLVSRPVHNLTPEEVAGGAVESLAENFTDAVVGPFLFWVVAGLPGAVTYRFLNTADAVLGYRDPVHEHLGKPAALLDDLANLIPARLAALLLLAAGGFTGGDVRGGLRVLLRDRRRTASPNAGWTMSAMAGLLDVRLTKRGAYALGDSRAALEAGAIARAQWITGVGMLLAVGGALAIRAILDWRAATPF